MHANYFGGGRAHLCLKLNSSLARPFILELLHVKAAMSSDRRVRGFAIPLWNNEYFERDRRCRNCYWSSYERGP